MDASQVSHGNDDAHIITYQDWLEALPKRPKFKPRRRRAALPVNTAVADDCDLSCEKVTSDLAGHPEQTGQTTSQEAGAEPSPNDCEHEKRRSRDNAHADVSPQPVDHQARPRADSHASRAHKLTERVLDLEGKQFGGVPIPFDDSSSGDSDVLDVERADPQPTLHQHVSLDQESSGSAALHTARVSKRRRGQAGSVKKKVLSLNRRRTLDPDVLDLQPFVDIDETTTNQEAALLQSPESSSEEDPIESTQMPLINPSSRSTRKASKSKKKVRSVPPLHAALSPINDNWVFRRPPTSKSKRARSTYKVGDGFDGKEKPRTRSAHTGRKRQVSTGPLLRPAFTPLTLKKLHVTPGAENKQPECSILDDDMPSQNNASRQGSKLTPEREQVPRITSEDHDDGAPTSDYYSEDDHGDTEDDDEDEEHSTEHSGSPSPTIKSACSMDEEDEAEESTHSNEDEDEAYKSMEVTSNQDSHTNALTREANQTMPDQVAPLDNLKGCPPSVQACQTNVAEAQVNEDSEDISSVDNNMPFTSGQLSMVDDREHPRSISIGDLVEAQKSIRSMTEDVDNIDPSSSPRVSRDKEPSATVDRSHVSKWLLWSSDGEWQLFFDPGYATARCSTR